MLINEVFFPFLFFLSSIPSTSTLLNFSVLVYLFNTKASIVSLALLVL